MNLFTLRDILMMKYQSTPEKRFLPGYTKVSPRFSLRRNVSWTILGNGVYAASQWGILIVLARLGGPEVVGRFALALAITAPVMIFSNLALRQVLVTDAKYSYLFSDYLALRVIMILLALIVIVAITWFSCYRGEMAMVILAVFLANAFEALSDIFYGLHQRNERLDFVACSLMLRGPLGLVALACGYYLTDALVIGVFSMAITWAAIWLMYDIPISRRWRQPVNDPQGKTSLGREQAGRWARLAWLAFPLGLATMIASLNTNIPRYFIEYYVGIYALGIFASMAYLVVAGGMVINAVGQAASPRLANYFAEQNTQAFIRLLGKMELIALALGGAGILAAALFGREILMLLYGPDFAEQGDVFVWVMLSAAVIYMASFMGYAMTALRIFRMQPMLLTVVAGINTLGCFLLIPQFGLVGAIWGWISAVFFQFLLSLLLNIRRLRTISTIDSSL